MSQSEFAKASRERNAAATALANHRFHAVIGEMAFNPYLGAALNRLLIDHTRLSLTFYSPANSEDAALIDKACGQHEALIKAIEVQDPALAMELTLQHWDLSRDRIERFVRPDPLPLDVVSMKDVRNAV